MKLSSDALERIKQTVREAEIELKRAISQLGTQASFAAYLRIFTSFACAKFDAEAGEWISACGGDSEFADLLDRKIKPRIIESILPDQSLSKVGVWSREKNANIVVHHDMDNGTFWEADESGIRRPARKEIQGAYAPHGEWENFVDDHLRFALRFPADNKQAREALAQSLQRRIFHWVGRFQQRVPIEIVGESSDSGISGHPEDSASTADTIPDSTPREIVKRWMNDNHLTTAQAAKLLAVGPTVLAALKRGSALKEGRCGVETLRRVAALIGCQPEQLEHGQAVGPPWK